MLPPRGALHHHHNAAALRAKLHQQQQQQQQQQAHYDHGSASAVVRTMSGGDSATTEDERTPSNVTAAVAQQQAAAAAAALALFAAPSLPNISAYHQSRPSTGILGASLPAEPLSSAIGGPLFFSVPSMLPYLNAAALQQAAAAQAAAAASAGAMGSPWSQQLGGRPLFDFAGGGGLVEGNRRTPTTSFGSHHGQVGHSGGGGSHGLLKQQLRDLLLRYAIVGYGCTHGWVL